MAKLNILRKENEKKNGTVGKRNVNERFQLHVVCSGPSWPEAHTMSFWHRMARRHCERGMTRLRASPPSGTTSELLSTAMLQPQPPKPNAFIHHATETRIPHSPVTEKVAEGKTETYGTYPIGGDLCLVDMGPAFPGAGYKRSGLGRKDEEKEEETDVEASGRTWPSMTRTHASLSSPQSR